MSVSTPPRQFDILCALAARGGLRAIRSIATARVHRPSRWRDGGVAACRPRAATQGAGRTALGGNPDSCASPTSASTCGFRSTSLRPCVVIRTNTAVSCSDRPSAKCRSAHRSFCEACMFQAAHAVAARDSSLRNLLVPKNIQKPKKNRKPEVFKPG